MENVIIKKINIICAVALFAFVQLSCGSKDTKSNRKLLYWSSNNSDEITWAREVVAEWNKEHPYELLQFQPVPEGQSSEEVILAAVVGGTTPDIYSNMWQGDVELYARAGRLVALDTLPGFRDFLYKRCDSSVVKEVTSLDGHIYQIPWKINPIMLIYNKNMFAQAGFSNPPRTYSEFLQAAKKIQGFDPSTGYVDRWIGYTEVVVLWWQRLFDFYPLYLAASGGAPLIKDNKVAFDNKYAVETFSFLKSLFDRNYFPRERLSARQDPFLGGDIATRFTGPWEIIHAERFKPEGFNYSFSPLPVPDDFKGTAYTYGDTKNIVIFNTCKNPRLAWEFLKLMISHNGDLKLLKNYRTNTTAKRPD
jgi:multiple sugar transport system substrate-binding protein